jgi:hypothetical protein
MTTRLECAVAARLAAASWANQHDSEPDIEGLIQLNNLQVEHHRGNNLTVIPEDHASLLASMMSTM